MRLWSARYSISRLTLGTWWLLDLERVECFGTVSLVTLHVPFPRQVRQFLNEDIVKDLMTSAGAQAELEREFQQLTEDRNQLRDIFKQPNPRVCGRGVGGVERSCAVAGVVK